ncbi:molybdopterin molybdotransferase MoeA [Aliifodinibius salicampi]|uniref:Molybdopterin molybdenumtransferase n=1 Tax=Fodinibius salicampi TaxID=1920655 RepID=A0ABT3Q1Z5_9BACT|nr:molybdopterin molybdotransferase MoeA [Fodinibius salicampi]MCW9714125.1 molybdopterin molybdotransferase MoeA [Fodinibius salicampi]
MIGVSEASDIINGIKLKIETEKLDISETVGMILRESITLDRDLPPFDRVMMDGIAIQYDKWEQGQSVFPVEGLQKAGGPKQVMDGSGHCMEVMTGAILPGKTDTVIRYEDIEIQQQEKETVAVIQKSPKAKGQNIHPKGTNRPKGDLVANEGMVLSPAEIGVAATVGKTRLNVSRVPEVAVISTGDELVPISQRPLPHQIRRSNAYTISAALRELHMEAELFHLNDDRSEISKRLDDILKKFELVILSGGVSKGKLDYIPGILEQKGVEKLFHKVRQRPGKPFWFGKSEESVVFALPGNPVSTFSCCYRYVMPWLKKQLGISKRNQLMAQLTVNYTFEKKLTYFLQVKVEINDEGIMKATPVKGKGSSDLANLCKGDGFLELPEDQDHFKAGESYPLFLYRTL